MQHKTSVVRRLVQTVMLCVLAFGLVSCGGRFPADPDGSLNRVSGGTLRIGVSHQPPWTDTSNGNEADPGGIEARMIEDYAASIDAEVEWRAGGEEFLIGLLADGELDLVIGGLTSKSPWSSDAALTTSYAQSVGIGGSTDKHVMAVRMGENAFMTSLEKFLLDADVDEELSEDMRP